LAEDLCDWLGRAMSLLTILWPYKQQKPQEASCTGQTLFDTDCYRKIILVTQLHILGDNIHPVNHIQNSVQTEARHYYIGKIDQ
jgi:hypothetical protein